MRPLFPLLLLMGGLQSVCLALPGADTKPAPPAKVEKISTVTYDVADLVRDAAAWRTALVPTPALAAPRAQLSAIEALVDLLQREVSPESWRSGKEGVNSLRVFNGVKLEVRAPVKQQAEIKDLLAALRRLADLSVLFEVELHEVEPAYYKKNIAPLLGGGQARPERRFAVLVKDEVETQLHKQGKPLKWSKVNVPAGQSAPFFSLRQAFTYQARPKIPGRRPVDVYASGFSGVSFRADVRVSADRRTLRLQLTQQVKELVEIDRDQVIEATTGKRELVEVPRFFDSTAATTVDVDDGVLLLMPVQFRARGAKDRGRAWVLLVRPSILIGEEERARRNNQGAR